MVTVPVTHALLLAVILFVLGLTGVLARRDFVFMLMSIEVMLNATGLALIAAGARWSQADGQIMFMLVLTLAAAEIAVGLALVLLFYQRSEGLDADAADRLKG